MRLLRESSPYSFYLHWMRTETERWFEGGMIYYRQDESGVGGPQFSVRIGDNLKEGWSIHT